MEEDSLGIGVIYDLAMKVAEGRGYRAGAKDTALGIAASLRRMAVDNPGGDTMIAIAIGLEDAFK